MFKYINSLTLKLKKLAINYTKKITTWINKLPMNLKEAYLVTKDRNERLGEHKLDLFVL